MANFLRNIHSTFFDLIDTREEWEKDRWDVRVLYDKCGIEYNKSTTDYYINFTKIQQIGIREQVKKYMKQRLLNKNNFTWGSALRYHRYLPKFFSFVFMLEPTWSDLKEFKRSHMEQYIQWLHEYAKNNLRQRNSHPEKYISYGLSIVGKFLEDIQRYEYTIAPKTHMRLLLFPEDRPRLRKKSIDQIDFIPDFVLEQLFANINELHKGVQPTFRKFCTLSKIRHKSGAGVI
ncbi:hypothetical protein [Cytobacillus sp. NCCP-133]|uniref:hypothetical protein n=1 Tax=Cytobacillus sp. NCCP-133 TaxID=766848 RepID=UPI002852A863|nr:hypothetical protein [Cytobacillus sp. NCCP-133]